MTEDERALARRKLIEAAIDAAVGLAFLVSMDPGFRSELTLRWRKLQAWWTAARSGYSSGVKVAEWFVQDETKAVIADAEAITRQASAGAGGGAPSVGPSHTPGSNRGTPLAPRWCSVHGWGDHFTGGCDA